MTTTPPNRRLKPRLFDFDYLILTALRDTLAPMLAECPGTVVDFGCGTKPYQSLCGRAGRYVGADLEVSEPGDLALAPDGRVPLPDGSADAVVSFQVLEHVPDVDFYLAECNRLLRPGGQLVLSTHGIWAYHPMAGVCEDYWRWTAAGLRRVIEKHGFERLEVRPVCEGWQGFCQQMLVSCGGGIPHRRRAYRLVRQSASVLLNSFCKVVGFGSPPSRARRPDRANGNVPGPTQPGYWVPICYVVRAWKKP